MNFILIPFFLATNLIINDDAWYNGPEYSFSVHWSIISDLEKEKGRYMGKALLMTLKCLPREDYLICHFEDAKIGKWSSKKFDREGALPARNTSYERFNFSVNNFVIKFHQNGIDHYLVEKDDKLMNQILIDMFRTIVNQLNIATNLDQKDDNFQEKQIFFMGECPADYKILRSKVNNYCDNKKFDLVLLIDSKLNDDEIIRIKRQIVLDQCAPPDLYYFIGRDIHSTIFENTTDRLISSESNTRISKNCFTTETLNIVDIYDQEHKKLGNVLDHLYISLDSIHPAQASRISVDIESLLHGPEYTYRVEIITVKKAGGQPCASTDVKAFDAVSTLKCRPRVPDTLNCRFEAAKMQIYEEALYELARETVEDLWMDDEPFEIIFDKNGIKNLIVTKHMKPWIIDMIRSIVNQLNIGVDIRNKQDGIFTTTERSFLGECPAKIELYHGLSYDNQWKDEKFEIIPMNGINKVTSEFFRIEKRRNINDCEHGVYFFASKSAYTNFPRDVTVTIKSSTSRIIISDSNYTSYTVNEFLVTNKAKTRNFTFHEKINLNLETISAPINDIPLIPDATSVSFMI
uniref:Vitellogenin domain-containing protein n=1 Tax=Vespula pensylvanica TaxID=30213 RepID=A0A834JTV7_VESPE|nr:hypothetical protein H0235_016862 [Vespula pensylvanica]